MCPADSATLADRTDGARTELATRHAGRRGPTVGWIHGYTMDATMFDDVWAAMPGFRHVGVDLPGHGNSYAMGPHTTMTEMARAVADVLVRHGARLLVAVSLGSMTAFEVAIKRLCPLDGLAVIAPALVGMPAAAGTADRYRLLTRMRQAGVPSSALVQLWMSSPPDIFAGLARHPEKFAALRTVIARHRWRELDFGGPAAFYRDPQTVTHLPGSARRLLVMSGEEDMPEFRDLARRIDREVPSASALNLPGAGHLPLLEDPDAAIAPLARFLSDAGAAARADTRAGTHIRVRAQAETGADIGA